MTSRSDTQAASIEAPADQVFAFLADPGNLPRWAVGFGRGIRREASQWIVETAQGDLPIAIVADVERGTIDFHMRVAPGVETVAYSRVVANESGAEYVFTQFQGRACRTMFSPGNGRRSRRN